MVLKGITGKILDRNWSFEYHYRMGIWRSNIMGQENSRAVVIFESKG